MSHPSDQTGGSDQSKMAAVGSSPPPTTVFFVGPFGTECAENLKNGAYLSPWSGGVSDSPFSVVFCCESIVSSIRLARA